MFIITKRNTRTDPNHSLKPKDGMISVNYAYNILLLYPEHDTYIFLRYFSICYRTI
jgi:hypothetical protein